MKTKRMYSCIVWLSLAASVFADAISVRTDKADAIYEVGGGAVFTVSGLSEGVLNYVLSNEGKTVLKKAAVPCKGEGISIIGTLDRPGFLQCAVTFTPTGQGQKQSFKTGAGFAPDKIQPAQGHLPDDFDAFWERKMQELAAVPMNPVMTAEPNEPGVEIYDVQLDCVNGVPVRGYYARPAKAAKGSCPAIAFFHGKGVVSASKERIIEYCREGFIAFEINAHGLPNGQPKKYYDDLDDTTLDDYKYFGREDPNENYFTGMFLRVHRALAFLKAQPEWDGRHLVTWGASQGGAQSIAGAGLDPEVTFVFAGTPAMCDHGGVIAGWPRMIPVREDGSYDPTILQASRYVDCVNFARRIKAGGLFTVGFTDTSCRPTSVYAMYNTFAGPKEIINGPSMGHDLPPDHIQMAKDRILKHVKASCVTSQQ